MSNINVNAGSPAWQTTPSGPGGGVQGANRGATPAAAGALASFALPNLSSPEGVLALAKPVLKGAFGVDLGALDGQSPFTLVAGLISQTRTQTAENRRDVISTAIGARGSAQAGAQTAADNYDIDVGGAIMNWAAKPENLEQGFKFAVQVVNTAVAAVASGGTSLVNDLPALGASAMGVADSILKDSGLSLQQVLGSAATDVLTTLGMDPGDAAKLGPFIASAGIAAMQVYNAVQSGDISGLDPKVFVSLAQNGAVLMGADQQTAQAVGTAVKGGISFAEKFVGGNSDLMNSGNLAGLMGSADILGKAAEAFLGGRNVDLGAVMGEAQNFLGMFNGVMRDLEKDTGISGLSTLVGNRFEGLMNDTFAQLGPFGPIAQMAMDTLLQNGFNNRSTV